MNYTEYDDEDTFMDYEYETYDHNPYLGPRDTVDNPDNWGINAPDFLPIWGEGL
jgi:hypothetical protein